MNSKLPFLKQSTTGRQNYYGVFRARCLNNNDPVGLGRVLVHIYNRDGNLTYNEATHQWIPVLSPFGGVRGMGFYMIPPIHAEGFVQFEEGDQNRPVWMGTYPDSPEKVIDQQASQSAGYGVVRVNPTVPPELGNDATRIVLKTQYPALNNPDPESNDNKVENLIVMDNTQLRLQHVNQSSYAFSPGGISLGTASSYITLSDGQIVLGVLTKDGKRYELSITSQGILIKSNAGDLISVTDGSILIQGGDKTQIKITANDNGSITQKAKSVVLDGEQIVLGPPGTLGGGGIVSTDAIDPFTCLPIHTGSSKVIVGG